MGTDIWEAHSQWIQPNLVVRLRQDRSGEDRVFLANDMDAKRALSPANG